MCFEKESLFVFLAHAPSYKESTLDITVMLTVHTEANIKLMSS